MSRAAGPSTDPIPTTERADSQPAPGGALRQSRLVSCSSDRTLVARRREDGRLDLVKIFEAGSLEDARKELANARSLALPGIKAPREAWIDPVTGRPALVMDYVAGQNLAELVTRRGPLPPATCARVVGSVARTLAAMHESAAFVHRDVKPANILVAGAPPDPSRGDVLLLDLEHATPLDSGRARGPRRGPASAPGAGFTGGTHGYAPPEAYAGAVPDAAFDVFGLGAVLWFVLTGEPTFAGKNHGDLGSRLLGDVRRRWLLAGAPGALRDLIERCLARDPAARPSAAAVAQALERYRAEGPLDAAWEAIRGGDSEEARQLLATAPGPEGEPPGRRLELQDLLERRARLSARARELPRRLPAAGDVVARARQVAAAVEPLSAFLARFPLHRDTLAARTRLRREAGRLLHEIPARVAECRLAARLQDAEDAILAVHAALLATTRFPGAAPLLLETVGDSTTLSRLRDPLRYLTLLLEDVRSERSERETFLRQLEQEEGRLDLAGADATIQTIAALNTGASEAVAALKDRVHRLGFYVERIAHSQAILQHLQEQLGIEHVEVDLGPAKQLQQLCAQRIGAGGDHATRGLGSARALLRALQDLAAEFPQTALRLTPAVTTLENTLEALSDAAWKKRSEIEHLLQAVPIPIRPLQTLVNRLDALRILDLLVDRPRGTQAELLSALETLRLKLEQARTTRDRITRSAQDSLDRGHITTALFDMQRAADRFAIEPDDSGSAGSSLAANLAEARRRRKDFDDSAGRNVRLAARYAALQDDPRSSREERIDTLERRREALFFLLENGPDDRTGPWQQDLRDVQVSLLQERADLAEQQLESTDDLDERARLCTRMLETLNGASSEPGLSASIGRMQRLLERWRQHRERVRADVRARADERRRRGLMRIVKAAVLLVLLGGVFQVARGMSRDDARTLALEELDKAATRAAAADAIVRLGAPPELVAALRGEGSLPATDAWLATLPRGDAARVRSALARW